MRNINKILPVVAFTYSIAVALIFLCVSIVACHKDSLISEKNNTTQDDSDYIEIDDTADDTEEPEPFQLETRASEFKIYRVKPVHDADTIANGTCVRQSFVGYKKLDILSGSQFEIIGKGFGSTKQDATIKASYKTSILFPVIINTWSDTSIVVSVVKFTSLVLPVLKNLSLKFIVEKDFTSTSGTVRRKVTKSIKGASWYKEHSYLTGLDPSLDAYYPSSIWEITYQMFQTNFGDSLYSSKIIINGEYTPKVGDVLNRQSVPHQYGYIKAIEGQNSRGETKIRVWERNYKCKGAIQKKIYYYKNGAFTVRYNEPIWTHYCKMQLI
jgi:hypothetical protein